MTKLKIKPVNHGSTRADRNNYCGPSVISAITGMTTGEAARLIRHVGGRKSIKGTHNAEILRSLRKCNINIDLKYFGLELGRTNGPTLAGWLKATVKERTADRVFLIVAGWHWQLVQGRRIVCGILGQPTSIRDKRVKRRARVAYCWELFSGGTITIPPEARKPKRQPDPNAAARRKAKKLMERYGFKVEYEYDMRRYWVCMSDEAEQLAIKLDHHLRDEHYLSEWQEIEWRMEDMAAFMDEHFPQKKAA